MFGGILADEMGLGKTLTVLSAILVSPSRTELSVNSSGCGYRLPKSSCGISAKETLIIVPRVLVLDEWLREAERHIAPNSLKIFKHHRQNRECTAEQLCNFDIVITTYATVASEFGRCSGPLYGINWFRIVLDEAHSIRHQRTRQFRAITALSATYRWCLTGTPVQNSLLDIGALLRFLRVPLIGDASSFRDHIVHPIESGKAFGFNNLRTLLKPICLRRSRDILHLPEPEEIIYELTLSPVEKDMYHAIGESAKQVIDDIVCGRKTMDAYGGILQVIMQLRLLCNHGTLHEIFRQRKTALPDPEEALALLQQTDDAICTMCSCDVDILSQSGSGSGSFTVCGHLLCDGCLVQYEEDVKNNKRKMKAFCPICQTSITGDGRAHSALGKEYIFDLIDPEILKTVQSVKLLKLMEDIQQYLHVDKSIIFSYWKKTLWIIAALLTEHKIPFVQINGSLSVQERRRVLTEFQENKNVPILLMTLGTGAEGLNITVASRIHIVEPQWNPSTERQAIGRSIRLGQEKRVKIVRYLIKDTVEEYIRSLQERKLQLAGIGWVGHDQAEEKLNTLRDLRSLI